MCLTTVKPVYKGHSMIHKNRNLYEQLIFIYRLKLYALFINGETETVLYIQCFVIQRCPSQSVLLYRGALYRQCFVIQRCPLQTVFCYIEVLFIDSVLLYRGALYRQCFAIQRFPLQTVFCHIEVPFIDSVLLYRGAV